MAAPAGGRLIRNYLPVQALGHVTEDCEISHKVRPLYRASTRFYLPTATPIGEFFCFCGAYRSISPITMSSEPTIAGTSAIRQPWHSRLVIERLQKQLLRARARHGIESPELTR
jgi:hypothetical protein